MQAAAEELLNIEERGGDVHSQEDLLKKAIQKYYDCIYELRHRKREFYEKLHKFRDFVWDIFGDDDAFRKRYRETEETTKRLSYEEEEGSRRSKRIKERTASSSVEGSA